MRILIGFLAVFLLVGCGKDNVAVTPGISGISAAQLEGGVWQMDTSRSTAGCRAEKSFKFINGRYHPEMLGGDSYRCSYPFSWTSDSLSVSNDANTAAACPRYSSSAAWRVTFSSQNEIRFQVGNCEYIYRRS